MDKWPTFARILGAGWQEWIRPSKPEPREVSPRPIDEPVVKVMDPSEPKINATCPQCHASDNIVIRYGKYVHNVCGAKWDARPMEPPTGQRTIALEVDSGPPRYGLAPDQWPAKWRW